MTWIGGIFRAALFRVILLGLILRPLRQLHRSQLRSSLRLPGGGLVPPTSTPKQDECHQKNADWCPKPTGRSQQAMVESSDQRSKTNARHQHRQWRFASGCRPEPEDKKQNA